MTARLVGVSGPASSTDEAIARFDGTSGHRVQDSSVTINDAGDMMPTGDLTQDMGSSAMRWDKIRGQQVFGLGGNVAPTVSSAYGVIAGRNTAYGGGSSAMTFGGGGFPPLGILGNVYSSGGGASASMTHGGGGSFMVGSAYANGTNTSVLQSNNSSYGSFTGGYSYGGQGYARIWNRSSGGFVWGYPNPTGSGTHLVTTTSGGAGAFVVGRTTGQGNATIQGGNSGAFAQGFVQPNTGRAGTIAANGQGSFAQGRVRCVSADSNITATNAGSFAQGNVQNATITATGTGAFAQGSGVTNNITASGTGSFAQGASAGGAISASATNAVQFGPGSNTRQDSLQVGTQFNFKGTTGLTVGPFVGCMAVNAGYVYIYSNAQWCKVTNAVL